MMRRYPAYRATGVDWLGEVPDGWEVKRLRHIASLQTEKATTSDYPIALENIEGGSGRIIETETEFAGEGVAFRSGDILFGKLRPYLAKVSLADRDGEAVGDFHVLRPGPNVAGRFLQLHLLTPAIISVIDGSTYGSKMPRAGWDFMADLRLALPPLAEQTAIAAFLGRETGKIDALVAEQRRLIDLLREKRQATISHAVTRGLNPAAPLKPSGVDWLGDVPEGWEVVKIKSIARMESGHTPDRKIAAYWEQGDIQWVSLNDTRYLKDHEYIGETAYQITQAGIENSSARLLPAGVVVFSRDATIGRCAITTCPMAVSQHFIAWVPGEKVVAEFLLFCLRAMEQELERMTFGATLKTIGMPDVRKLSIALPSLQEQTAIVGHIRKKSTLLDALISDAESAISLLLERRAALISAAVTGKIDVREDAPA